MANEPIQGLPYPLPSDTNDPPRDIKALADATVTRTNMVFATTGAGDAVLTSPTNGMERFTGSGQSAIKQIRHNGSWKPMFEDTGWIDIAPAAGYTATSLACRRVNNVVYLRGVIVRSAGSISGDAAETCFTLPAGFASTLELRITVNGAPILSTNNGAVTVLSISTSGVATMRRGAGPAGSPAVGSAYVTGISWPLG